MAHSRHTRRLSIIYLALSDLPKVEIRGVPVEILTWTFIATLYIAAFAVLQLEKHWYRTAQVFFTLATLLAIGRLVLWVWNNPDGLHGGVAFVVAIVAIVVTIWFVRKVEGDIQAGQLEDDDVDEIRPFYDLLTSEEKRVLRFILPLHRSPTNLNVGQITALESIQQKTGFVGRNYTTGAYEMNSKIVEALKNLLASEPPYIEISYRDRSPFVSDGKGNSGILYKQRRVSVTSSVQGKVSLKVPELSIGGTNYPNVHLRPMQGQAEVLEPGETGYWYVVQMNSHDNSIKLVHIGNSEYNLGRQAQFEIVARCSGAVASKIVTATIDKDKNLHFQLDDPGNAPTLPIAAAEIMESADVVAANLDGVEARKSKNEVLEDLIAFRNEGDSVRQKAREGFMPNLIDSVIEWEGKVGSYLAIHVGHGDAEHFLSNENMDTFTSAEKPKVTGQYPASQDLLDRIYTRGNRLKKIIADLQAGRTL